MALAMTPGVGGRSVTRVSTRNEILGRSTHEFLALGVEALVEEYRMPRRGAEVWDAQKGERLRQAIDNEQRLSALGVSFVTGADSHYPSIIEELDPDPPGVLYYYGNHRLLSGPTFAVLASRKAPPVALAAIEQLTEERVLQGQILVSGHNTPEYRQSAVVPLRYGSPRVLVLDRELFDALGDDLHQEPFAAARLWRHEFDPKTDFAITAIHPHQPSHQGANRQRDRLVAALSRSLTYAWIGAGGNMEKLARLACNAKRNVEIVDLFPGAKEWERYGAKVVEPKPSPLL